ncbi:MAG: hypothetical protein WBY47_18165 [Desulfobacterales bacterium]|jgi:hypothetical protein
MEIVLSISLLFVLLFTPQWHLGAVLKISIRNMNGLLEIKEREHDDVSIMFWRQDASQRVQALLQRLDFE